MASVNVTPAGPGGSEASAPGSDVAAQARPAAPLHVFLVEDSPIIRERLTESLTAPGRIEVIGYADTEHGAVAALRDAAWDVLVLDLQLKQGTGLGVLKALAGARPDGAKIIVLTNYAIPQFRDRSVALGADYFFDKSREYYRVKTVLEDIAASRGSGGARH